MMRYITACCILLLAACKKDAGTIPVTSADPLSKGINLSNWFNDYSDPAQYSTRFSSNTLALIHAEGFTYVRIPIGPAILFNAADPGLLNTANLKYVNNAVKNCINAGLAVTLDLHPSDDNTDKQLATDASYVDKIAAYWKAMAAYFKQYPADKIYFEVYNEPHVSAAGLIPGGYDWWPPVQQKFIDAIRTETTKHYIIVGGEAWNGIGGLTSMQPYSDAKCIYNFHFYDPFLFTHQGASWAGWEPAMNGHDIPYPSSPDAVAPLIAASQDQELNDALSWYGYNRYNIDSLDNWVKAAYNWGRQNNVRIIVNEFGSYKPNAPRQSRLNWIHDARTVFEKYNIGWAMWECDEGFGWIDYSAGNRNNPVVDADVLHALGL